MSRPARVALGEDLAFIACVLAAAVLPLAWGPWFDGPFVAIKRAVYDWAGVLALAGVGLVGGPRVGARLPRLVVIGMLAVLATLIAAFAMSVGGRFGAHLAEPSIVSFVNLFALTLAATTLSEGRRRTIAWLVTAAASIVALFGLAQHFTSTPFIGTRSGLPGSTFGYRNQAAEWLVLALPFTATRLVEPGRTARSCASVALVLEVALIVATRARGSWLALAAVAALSGWMLFAHLARRHALLLVGSIAVVAAIAVAAPFGRGDGHDDKRDEAVGALLASSVDRQTPALRSRIGLWSRSAEMFRDHPWWGVGPGNWPIALGRYAEPNGVADGVIGPNMIHQHAHLDVLERAAETGIVGTLAWLLWVFGTSSLAVARLRVARRARQGGGEHRAMQGAGEHHAMAGAGEHRATQGAGDYEARDGATIGAAAWLGVLVIGLTAFPLEMPGTLALTAIALGHLVPPPVPDDTTRALSRGELAFALVALLAALVLAPRPFHALRASYHVARASELLFDAAEFDADAALAQLDAAERAAPSSLLVRMRRVQVLIRAGRAVEAEAAARATLPLQPYGATVWNAIALAELMQGRNEEARDHSAHALELMADFPRALEVHARASERLGDRATAVRDRARARELSSDTHETRSARPPHTDAATDP